MFKSRREGVDTHATYSFSSFPSDFCELHRGSTAEPLPSVLQSPFCDKGGSGHPESLCDGSGGLQIRQVSLSSSRVDVVRGIHVSPYRKHVQCVAGSIYDGAWGVWGTVSRVGGGRRASPLFSRICALECWG